MKTKHIAITGANGQLGLEFQKLTTNQIAFSFLTRTELDISNQANVQSYLTQLKPDIIINCAAYTAVDKAEEDVNEAFAINDHGAYNLANTANDIGAKLIHISTDYVYHIDTSVPLSESDECEPKSIYGKSKRAGELSIIGQLDDHLILRVSWLYAAQKNNFVKTMLRLGKERSSLNIVNDQHGAPTYAKDLVMSIMHIINNHPELTGIYNFCNSGTTTWQNFAEKIFELSNLQCKVNGISTASYGAPAPRPLWSVMSTANIQDYLPHQIPHWTESLKECLEELGAIA